jgi:RNA polymerase sigma-70 factor (ECF subfamily)
LAEEPQACSRQLPFAEGSARRDAAPPISREFAQEVFSLVFHQMRSLAGFRPDLDDLVQTAAERVLRSLGTFEGRSKMSTWTYRICYFTVCKHDRCYRRWLRRFVLTEGGELPEVAAHAHHDTPFETRERAACLRRAVARLSPKRRTVLVLHDLEGLSIDEVAAVVEAAPGTVRSRLRDGRKDLARILAADSYFGDDACARREIPR